MARISSRHIACCLVLVLAFLNLDSLLAKMVENGAVKYRTAGAEGSVPLQDCPKACEYRCSATSHKKPCLFYCNYCCQKCLCVPSGTYGHREECPCYNNLKTKEGANKCP